MSCLAKLVDLGEKSISLSTPEFVKPLFADTVARKLVNTAAQFLQLNPSVGIEVNFVVFDKFTKLIEASLNWFKKCI